VSKDEEEEKLKRWGYLIACLMAIFLGVAISTML